jgi:diguanylate cyclase (GGDEF)-like protein
MSKPAITPDASDDTRIGLVSALFADWGTLIPGGLVAALSAFACAYIAGSVGAVGIGLAILIVTGARVQLARFHDRRRARGYVIAVARYEHIYTFGSTCYMLCSGLFVYWAFTCTNDPFILTISLFAALTNALSIAVRSFAIRYGVELQVTAVMAPLGIAFAIRGAWFWALTVLVGVLGWFIISSASRLRNILLSEMEYRRRSDSIARQFDFAINNMSHGMCMMSSDFRIQVSNGKFVEFFGLRATRGIENVRFPALLRFAARSGKISMQDRSRLLDAFRDRTDASEETAMQIETSGGGVCDLTIKSNANGGWVVVVQDVTEKRQAERVIDHMARFDAVTNLRNRRSFEMALTQALADARVTGGRTEVLFLDLDGFKQVNDTLGHKTGDRVLAEAAMRLTSIAGEGDLIARWGGDEFVILRRGNAGGVDVETFADQVIAGLSLPSTIDGTDVVVGASVGISVAEAGEPTMDIILQQADMALYAAKREARGRYRLYEDAMSETASARRLLELDLQAALASRAFELHYQPIVNLQTQAIVSFEALACWRHPIRGQVSPALFVPVLEELNLMNRFGDWALQRACEDAVKWPQAVRVGVNVSAKQLESDTLYDSVVRALERSGLSARRLELEITETALLRGAEAVGKTLERVRALGVKIALDDFGTGFSSLSHLMRLPLDKVKIDQSFTRQLGRERKAEILIENIARLSSQLGMVVTVEGIETLEQLDHLRELGSIGEGQGYLFSKPLSLKDVSLLFPEPRQNVA